MNRRINTRISDEVCKELDRIVSAVESAGGQSSRSQLVRALIEKSLGFDEGAKGEPEPSSYEKGTAFELEVFEDIARALWDAPVERLQARPGERASDVRGPFFDVECKAGRRPSTRQALQQSREACGSGRSPVVVIRDDDAEPFAVCRWDTFLALWRCAWELHTFAGDLADRFENVEE
jgi:hypothetical protein